MIPEGLDPRCRGLRIQGLEEQVFGRRQQILWTSDTDVDLACPEVS